MEHAESEFPLESPRGLESLHAHDHELTFKFHPGPGPLLFMIMITPLEVVNSSQPLRLRPSLKEHDCACICA